MTSPVCKRQREPSSRIFCEGGGPGRRWRGGFDPAVVEVVEGSAGYPGRGSCVSAGHRGKVGFAPALNLSQHGAW